MFACWVGREPYSAECVERLSDKALKGSRRFGLAVLKVAKWCFWARFDHSWESRPQPFPNYQTVSEGEFCELRHYRVLGSPHPACTQLAPNSHPRLATSAADGPPPSHRPQDTREPTSVNALERPA